MAGFYAARISTTPTLQWMVLSPPYTGGDAEPSLAEPESHTGSQVTWLRGNDQDREAGAPDIALPVATFVTRALIGVDLRRMDPIITTSLTVKFICD